MISCDPLTIWPKIIISRNGNKTWNDIFEFHIDLWKKRNKRRNISNLLVEIFVSDVCCTIFWLLENCTGWWDVFSWKLKIMLFSLAHFAVIWKKKKKTIRRKIYISIWYRENAIEIIYSPHPNSPQNDNQRDCIWERIHAKLYRYALDKTMLYMLTNWHRYAHKLTEKWSTTKVHTAHAQDDNLGFENHLSRSFTRSLTRSYSQYIHCTIKLL